MVKILPKLLMGIEILGLIVSATGYLFKVLQFPGGNQMLMIGLLTLSTAYFLSGFVMVPVTDDGKPKGLADLLPAILRKLMYIGLSVFIVGFLFALLHLAGANEMLMLSVGTLMICVLISIVLVLGNRERMVLLKAPLIRSVIVLFVFLISYLHNS